MNHEITRLAVHGVGAGALAGATYGFGRTVQLKPLGGSKLASLPVWAVGGLVGVASTMAVDAVHSWILPYVPGDAKWRNREALALGMAASSAAYAGILYGVNPDVFKAIPMKQIVLGGAAIEAAGQWAVDLQQGSQV